jgi:Ion channel
MPERAQQVRDRERPAGPGRRLVRSFHSTDSYGLVLLMIVTTYVLATALSQRWAASVLRTSQARRGLRLAADGLFVLAAVAAVANLRPRSGLPLEPSVFVASGVLYLVAPFSIVRHIAYRRAVDRETMLGALAAYLFIGMAFAFVYRFLGAVQASTFFGDEGDGTLSQDLFFSFVTLTTTGYGNLVPAGNPGQSLAVLEALMGQLFLVTAVGKLVSAWRPRGWRDPSPGTESPLDRSG